ncbi:hypothetical protein FACS1894187_19780 [Synergistales bacterium]|nr:hypothetical protein FACS1894187_19780 [Synergistales bacterium]
MNNKWESFVHSCELYIYKIRARVKRSEKKTHSDYDSKKSSMARQEELLHVINEAAIHLLSSNRDKPKDALWDVMGMIARCVGFDRVYIWTREIKDGEALYSRFFAWDDTARTWRDIVYAKMNFPPAQFIPEWEERFVRRESINISFSKMSQRERERFESRGIKTIVAIPIYLHDSFWGVVSFDDTKNERAVPDDELNIMRSASLLLANAVTRGETIRMNERQAALLNVVNAGAAMLLSASAEEEFEDTLSKCMGMLSRFMRVNRMRIWKNEETDSNLYYTCVYQWDDEARRPDQPKSPIPPKHIRAMYRENLPRWGKALMAGSCISGAIKNFPQKEQDRLRGIYGILSVLVIPIHYRGSFWGFVSFDDCQKEREFLQYEETILRAACSILASAMVHDTAMKNLVKAREDALSASRAKSDFLSNMSHEMRTPMNAIIGMTAIGKASNDIERKNDCLQKIDGASTHLLGVINDILDMSKIEANKLELSYEEFNFEKCLQKVTNVVNFRVEEKRQELLVYIDKSTPHTIISDDQRLAQVITNLLSNAVKFTPPEGTISLNCCLLEEKDGVCLIETRVTDTGIGISEEQQPRLFRSFEQAESGTSRKFGGTGLGLAISKRIVEMMDGQIWIESVLGSGSTFAFTIQAKRGSGEARPRLLDDGIKRENLRVMAVDDAPEIRDYFKDIMARVGIACDLAESGEEAVDILGKNGDYDIYFVDWKMPGMDGIELSRRIKSHRSKKTVVIMISATEWNIIEDEAKGAGVDMFLAKPLYPSTIMDCINECLGVGAPKEDAGAACDVDCFRNHRIILSEDVEINREIVITLLEPTALTVDCAENGEEAVKLFSAAPELYDMIFMDVQMPVMDGYEATRRIRALPVPEAKSIPIVAMTANVFRDDIEKCLAVGMNDHLGKPLNLDEMMEVLHKYLTRKKGGAVERRRADGSDWKHGLAWTAELETGNEKIDAQHKELFKLASNLITDCVNGRCNAELGQALNFLASYTVRHFADEEQLQVEYGYPEYESHKALHDAFKQTVAELVAQYEAKGTSDSLGSAMSSVVVQWLIKHITQEDKKIAIHIRKIN